MFPDFIQCNQVVGEVNLIGKEEKEKIDIGCKFW